MLESWTTMSSQNRPANSLGRLMPIKEYFNMHVVRSNELNSFYSKIIRQYDTIFALPEGGVTPAEKITVPDHSPMLCRRLRNHVSKGH